MVAPARRFLVRPSLPKGRDPVNKPPAWRISVSNDSNMHFVRQYRSWLIFATFLVVCSVMVIRQIVANQARHVELREAFILLHTRGYTNQAEHLYQRLLKDKDGLSTKNLLDDFQRTMTLVEPYRDQPSNLLWVYHWTISKELDQRYTSEENLRRALKLAEKP